MFLILIAGSVSIVNSIVFVPEYLLNMAHLPFGLSVGLVLIIFSWLIGK